MTQDPIHFYVMVPVYNVERYLDECIRSVLDQTYRNFTLILVDDGSTDRSGAICEEYAKKDGRIRVYHKPNGGLLHTRRFAIHEAGRDGYGVFADSDDKLRPHALETIAKTIEKTGCDCVIYGMEDITDDGQVVGRSRLLSPETVMLSDKRELYRAVLLGEDTAFYSLCRKAVRMELLTPDLEAYAPYYRVVMGEDGLQSLEIYQKAERVCFIPDMLYCVRSNPTSIMHSVRYENYQVDFTRYEAEWEFVKRENVFNEEDFFQHRTMLIHCLTGDLVRIAGMETSAKNRAGLYDKIRETAYYRALEAGGAYDRKRLGKMTLIYEAFRRRAYWFIFLAQKLYRR